MSEQMESQPLCRICQKPLPPGRNLWHEECEFCQICNAPMHHATKVIQKCLDDGGPIAHLGCFHKATIKALKDHKVPILVRDITVMNEEILTMMHIVDPDMTDYATLHSYFCALRDSAIAVGHVLDCTKEKIKIVDRNQTEEWVKEKKKERAERQAVDSETEQQKVERSAMLAKERENPALRDKRKAIEGFMKGFGLTLEAATAAVEESMRKAGKDPASGLPLQ